MKKCKLARRGEDEENYFRGSRLTILSDEGEESGARQGHKKVVAVCAVWCGWLEGAARGSGNRGCDGGSRYLRFGRD